MKTEDLQQAEQYLKERYYLVSKTTALGTLIAAVAIAIPSIYSTATLIMHATQRKMADASVQAAIAQINADKAEADEVADQIAKATPKAINDRLTRLESWRIQIKSREYGSSNFGPWIDEDQPSGENAPGKYLQAVQIRMIRPH